MRAPRLAPIALVLVAGAAGAEEARHPAVLSAPRTSETASRIADLLGSPEVATRRMAAHALAQFGGAGYPAVPALLDLAVARDPAASDALLALARIAPQMERAEGVMATLRERVPPSDAAAIARVAVGLGWDPDVRVSSIGRDDAARARVDSIARTPGPLRVAAFEALAADVEFRLDAPHLADPDLRFRVHAALRVAGIPDRTEAAIAVLREGLESDDVPTRTRALDGFSNVILAAKDVLPRIATFLSDPDPGIRAGAARVLAEAVPYSKGSLPRLADLSADPVAFVRGEAIHAIGRIGSNAADVPEALHRFVHDPDPQVRELLLVIVDHRGDRAREHAATVREALRDESVAVRRRAFAIAERLRPLPEEWAGPLASIVSGAGDLDARVKAADLLAEIDGVDPSTHLPVLLALLDEDGGSSVARLVLRAGEPGVRALVERASDSGHPARHAASYALGQANESLKERDDVRRALLRARLGFHAPFDSPWVIDFDRDLPVLAETLDARRWALVQDATVELLLRAGRRGVEILVARLLDPVAPDLDLAYPVSRAPLPLTWPLLARALEHTDPYVRLAAAKALDRDDLPAHVRGRFVEHVADPFWRVRLAVVRFLAGTGASATELGLLVRRLQDRRAEVRGVAADALAGAGGLPRPVLAAVVARARVEPDPAVFHSLLNATGEASPDDRVVSRFLVDLVGSADGERRTGALSFLGRVRPDDPAVPPAVARLLDDPQNAEAAVRLLGLYGTAAKELAPAIERLATSKGPHQALAETALASVSGDTGARVRLLAEAARLRDLRAMADLAAMGREAMPALDALRSVAQDEHAPERYRAAAREAIRRIEKP